MGGRAQFVWPAYGIAALVLVALLVVSLRAKRASLRQLDEFTGGRRAKSSGPKSLGPKSLGAKTPGAKTPGAKTPGAKTPGARKLRHERKRRRR
ncbi:MAG: heme exporter protein CcmD [Alphaproteobacteria bacterium]